MNRKLTIAAGVFLAVTACAYGALVLAVDWILERATNECSQCLDERRSRDPLSCEEHRADFGIARLVPWKNEETDAALTRCLTGVHDAAIQWATILKPDAETRDAILARIDEPSDQQLYLAGAFDRLIERGSAQLLIDEAMQTRSLDMVKAAASLSPAGDEGVGRRAAWLCLLGERERGLELMRRWVRLNTAPPDLYPTGFLAPLGLYACGGEQVDGMLGTYEPMTLLQMYRGEVEPIAFLTAETRWSARGRRLALAQALDEQEQITLDVFEWLRGSAASDHTCGPTMLDVPALPIDPHAALRSAERLLEWVASDREAIVELQGRLPARVERIENEDGESDDVPRYEQIAPDLIEYVRRVARDLRWDAGQALFARGELAEGNAAFEAAVEIGARRCSFTRWLAGESPAEDEPSLLIERVVWLDGHDRHAEALALIEPGPEPWRGWWRAALGLRLGVDTGDTPEMGSPAAWWRGVYSGQTLGLRRAASQALFANSLRPTRRFAAGALSNTARFEVTGRANADADADLFHSLFAADATWRSALWAKAHAARRLGHSDAEHQAFYEEVASLANTPARAFLLTMALDELPDGGAMTAAPEDPPWDRPIFNHGSGCPSRVWAHFEGVPARDDAELAFRHVARERLVGESVDATYLVRARTTSTRIEGGVVRAAVRPMEYCDPGPSSRSGQTPFEDADAAIDDELEAFWDRHFVPDGDVVLLTLGAARLKQIHGIWIWEAEPLTIEAEATEMLRELLENAGRADVDLLVRTTNIRSDPRGGPRIEAEIVDARIGREREGWVRASPTRTPQTAGED